MKRKIGVMEQTLLPCIEGKTPKDSKYSTQIPKPHLHVHVSSSLRKEIKCHNIICTCMRVSYYFSSNLLMNPLTI